MREYIDSLRARNVLKVVHADVDPRFELDLIRIHTSRQLNKRVRRLLGRGSPSVEAED